MSSQNNANRYLIFIPTYNDFSQIPDILRGLKSLPVDYRVLIIDDGSTQQIDIQHFAPGVLYHKLPDNCGLGICIHIAICFALKRSYKGLIRVDADGQHPIESIPDLIQEMEQNHFDIVSGSRFQPDQTRRWDFLRRIVKKYYSFWSAVMTKNAAPKDVNTGFFLLGQRALTKLSPFLFGRYPEPQLFITACRQQLRVKEKAVIERPRLEGKSTLGFLQALRMLYRFNIFIMTELLRRQP